MTAPIDRALLSKNPSTEAMYDRLISMSAKKQFFRRLDDDHTAAFARGNDTLVVSFEQVASILQQDEEKPMPFGYNLREAFGWSFLSLLAERDTWFRSASVFDLFDALEEKGFFDGFDRVIFYGAGFAAHAACAMSIAAVGATVIAISPQATLNPDFSAFDVRYPAARRLDFTSRYGFAPDMLDGAEAVHLFFDPLIPEDAAHAALFRSPHISHHRLPCFGEDPASLLAFSGIKGQLFQHFERDALTDEQIRLLLRGRRTNRLYLVRLLERLLEADRNYLAALLCHNVAERMRAPRFRSRRDTLVSALNEQGIRLPFQDGADAA